MQAKNYYFSSSSGNDSYSSTQAQNQATPWKSIAKLNSFFGSIVAGDYIYFKCGDTFYGSIVVTGSGTGSSPITISSYGTGNKPVISGLTTLSSWTLVNSGIYQAAAPTVKNTVNLVTLNGLPQAVGRYPNATLPDSSKYLTYESFGTTSITDNQLTGATNWTGAEVVIRKAHYSMEKCKITSHSGSVINYAVTPSINPLNSINPVPVTATAGFGYFIQRDIRTLDQLGEWYFNTTTKNMQMYFGTGGPSAYTVAVSTIDTLINIGTNNYININNLSFTGANVAAIYAANAGNLTIQTCDMNLMGAKGVLIFNSGNVLVDGLTTNNILCGAIDITSRQQANVTVRNCNVKNTAMFPGMGSYWDDNDYKAISVSVSKTGLVEYNNIENAGFIAIQFQGSDIMVKNNFVNNYNIVKDDGGAIYTYQTGTDLAPGTVYTNRVVKENIVVNGVGAAAGTNGSADVDGIFLDGRVTNVDILNNTLANIGVNGIYVNNSINVNIRGNTSFNNGSAIGASRYTLGFFSNLSIKQNIFYPKYNTQDNFKYADLGINIPTVSTIQANMQKLGTIDSNYYSNPNPTRFNYYYSLVKGGAWTFPKPLSFEEWRSSTGHDMASKLTETIPSYKLNSLLTTNLVTNGQFTSNISAITVWSPNVITSTWDNTSKVTGTGSLKITPVLPNATTYSMIYGNVGAVSASKQYIFRFTTLGSASNGYVRAYIRKTASPLTTLTPIQVDNFSTTKQVHEFLFTAPTTDAAASFMIEVRESSGTTYIDDIEFYEADATVLNLDDQLRFEYNATKVAKTIALDASYKGVDNTVYNGSITLQPYTSKILVKSGAITNDIIPALKAAAAAPAIACFGNNTTVSVTGTGGLAPYTGTGSYTVNAGKGTLKIAVAAPVTGATTYLYSTIGAVSGTDNYVLRFSTLGTKAGGTLKAYLRLTGKPYTTFTAVQTASFGTSRVDHQFLFTLPAAQSAASFLIELPQSTGTVYVDNIAIFKATSTGVLISKNLYDSGQFENSIAGITTWSKTSNHVASLDLTNKITNTYYYPVTDANGSTAVASVATVQPLAPLQATSSAGILASRNSTTTVVINATGGTAPYTGTGNILSVKAGTYKYTITDAAGCTVVTTVTVAQSTAARSAGTSSATTGSIAGADSATNVDNLFTESGALEINAYPNPATNQFNLVVKGGTQQSVNVIVISAEGKALFKAKGNSNSSFTFGSNFAQGLYIVKVMQGNSSQLLKLIKGN